MRTTPTVAAVAVATALVTVSAAGCHSNPKSPTAKSESAASSTTGAPSVSMAAPAEPTGYASLLIRADDIDAPEAFTASPPVLNPDGRQGVAATFSTEDGHHVIVDTILILPDPAAAAAALDADKATLPGTVSGPPSPIGVGTGGTTVSGDSPDGSKGITMLRFTEGRAFVTLEFDGPPGMPAPTDFVTGVGQKQDAAIKDGLPG